MRHFVIVALLAAFFICVFSAFAYPGQPADTAAHIRKLQGILQGSAFSAYPLMFWLAG